jgi:tetratricopeptide (TPR) repeat protein
MCEANPVKKRLRSLAVLAAILALGALLRASYLRELAQEPGFATPLADAAFHDYWARSIVTGDWTPPANEADPRIREVPFLRPPGYPYFLALVYRAFGMGFIGPRVAQMALGLLNCLFCYALGRALFGYGAGFVAAAACATYWTVIYFEAELEDPVLFQTLSLSLFLILHSWSKDRTSSLAALAAGAALGLLALVRPNALLFVPVGVLWIYMQSRSARPRAWVPAAIFALGATLAVLPAGIRNWVVAKDFVPIASNGAVNFYIGNNAEADGVTPRIPGLQELTGASGWSWFSYDKLVRGLSREAGRELSYSQASRVFTRRALDHIGSHPVDALRLSGRRALLFWGPDEISNTRAIRFDKEASPTLRWWPSFAVVVAPAFLGLVLLLGGVLGARSSGGARANAAHRQKLEGHSPAVALLAAIFVLVYFLSFTPFLAAARFRAPLLPLLFVFAGHGIARAASFLRARQWGPFAQATLLGALLYFLASRSTYASPVDKAWWHTDRALALLRSGRPQDAESEFHAALAENPGYIDAHVHLAQALVDQKRFPEALPHIEEVLVHRPFRNDLRMQLGSIYMTQGRFEEAILAFQTGVTINPESPEGHFELGRAFIESGRPRQGVEALRRSLELLPDQPDAHVNVGLALERLGNLDEAIAEHRQALLLDPFSSRAHYHLGNCLQRTGDLDAAALSFREAIRIDPKFAEPMVHLGSIHNQSGRYEEAVEWFRKAIDADPRNMPARYNLAGALGNMGRIEEAIEVSRSALEVDPTYGLMRERLRILETLSQSPGK